MVTRFILKDIVTPKKFFFFAFEPLLTWHSRPFMMNDKKGNEYVCNKENDENKVQTKKKGGKDRMRLYTPPEKMITFFCIFFFFFLSFFFSFPFFLFLYFLKLKYTSPFDTLLYTSIMSAIKAIPKPNTIQKLTSVNEQVWLKLGRYTQHVCICVCMCVCVCK